MARLKALGGAVLDALYPPVCAACGTETGSAGGLCPACFREAPFIAGAVCAACGLPMAGPPTAGLVCDGCRHAPPAWGEGRAAALYDGPIRRAVLALKHGDRLDIATAAAPWLLRAGRPLVARADLIAPVPLHWTRLAWRRFNQSAELARALCRLAARPEALAPDLLRRIRRTPSQEGRSRAARHANMAGAVAVSRRWATRIEGRRVLLVDDVMTTGATLSACAEALRAAGAAGVDVLVLARVARGGDLPM
jgi:ComF family protein